MRLTREQRCERCRNPISAGSTTVSIAAEGKPKLDYHAHCYYYERFEKIERRLAALEDHGLVP